MVFGKNYGNNFKMIMNKPLKQYHNQDIHELGRNLSDQLKIRIDGYLWNELISRLWNEPLYQFASQLINGIANDYQ